MVEPQKKFSYHASNLGSTFDLRSSLNPPTPVALFGKISTPRRALLEVCTLNMFYVVKLSRTKLDRCLADIFFIVLYFIGI